MRRFIDEKLLTWRDSPYRKPLILRGARQVGKTYSVLSFGRKHFSDVVCVNLERDVECHEAFSRSLAPDHVVSRLESTTGKAITPGRTLLFLDEIQACPRAVTALRYLYEELPELHVVAAGSLLQFALGETGVPVGRVTFMDLHPMTFVEYLWAVGNRIAADRLMEDTSGLTSVAHDHLMDELRMFCFVGGMPAAVLAYGESHSLHRTSAVHRDICASYRQDFSKYSPRVDPHCLDMVFRSTMQFVGRQLQYTQLATDVSHRTIRRAFDALCKARVIRRVRSVTALGHPPLAAASRRFKAIALDIGLWQHMSGVRHDVDYDKVDLLDIHRGAMAEQFVGQEIVAAQDSDLFYWTRAARSSTAEVDYLAVVDGEILPIEVKSGATGRLRSMHRVLADHPDCPGGLVFSSRPYAELPDERLTFLPLYYAYSATQRSKPSEIPRAT
ncbi:ATP-binding protein [bacterium]|nr:ATP-binding protein [bacterium]